MRQRPRAALGLEQATAFESAACRAGQLARQLEIVVGEQAAAREEHHRERGLGAARLLDGHREQRREARLLEQPPPLAAEALVAVELARGQHTPLCGRCRKGLGANRQSLVQRGGERSRQLVDAGEHEPSRRGGQQRRCIPAERLGRGLRDGAHGRLERDRLTQHRGDPVEAALDTGLARPVLVALGVPQSKRGKPGERLEQLDVRGVETVRSVAHFDPDHSLHVTAPGHRRDERAGEALVRRRRHAELEPLVVVGRHGSAGPHRLACEAAFRLEFEAHQSRVEPMHRSAAQDAAFLVVEVAVGGVGAKQVRHLLDEPLEHCVELELARQSLGGVQQRGLLFEPARVLAQQPSVVEGEPELACDRLDQVDLGLRPLVRLRAVHGDGADGAVEDDERHGERGAGAETQQHLAFAE